MGSWFYRAWLRFNRATDLVVVDCLAAIAMFLFLLRVRLQGWGVRRA